MRNLYFNHNLFGFIHYMEQFAERKEILKLIFDMDKLNYYDSLLMPSSLFLSYKIQKQLNRWYKDNIKDENRRKQFDDCCLKGICYSKIDDEHYMKKLTR